MKEIYYSLFQFECIESQKHPEHVAVKWTGLSPGRERPLSESFPRNLIACDPTNVANTRKS